MINLYRSFYRVDRQYVLKLPVKDFAEDIGSISKIGQLGTALFVGQAVSLLFKDDKKPELDKNGKLKLSEEDKEIMKTLDFNKLRQEDKL